MRKYPQPYTIQLGAYVKQFYRHFGPNASAVVCALPERYVLEALAYGILGLNQRTLNRVRAIQHILTPMGLPDALTRAALEESWVALRSLFYAVSGTECGFLTHDVKIEYYFHIVSIIRKSR